MLWFPLCFVFPVFLALDWGGRSGLCDRTRSLAWLQRGILQEFPSKEIPQLTGEEWGAGRQGIRDGTCQRQIGFVSSYCALCLV